MKKKNLTALSISLRALAVFRELLSDPVLSALSKYLESRETDSAESSVGAYSAFVAKLYNARYESLAKYIQDIVNDDENVFLHDIGRGLEPSPVMKASVEAELRILQEVADLTPEVLREGLEWEGYLPGFKAESIDLAGGYLHRTENIAQYGYGIYARYHMFYLDEQNRIVPVAHPDETRLTELVDYKREQGIILDNTRALLAGKPAANILLTGDAGTGKSSTIKAVVNEIYKDGLRILEVRKEQLRAIPAILDELNANPLKFILFIDDLSFGKNDDNFSALKAILEGSVSAKAQNVVIYATSNRRHLVKEQFTDRQGDDIHFNDTMQEIISLSERFGIQITFNRPDKKTYLGIVRHLVEARGMEYLPEMDIAAERFALSRGTRSARAAKQFADSLITGADPTKL